MSDHSALLRAITRVLANDQSASMTDIATAAGVGRTTLHRTFGTRDDLMLAVARFVADDSDRVAALIGLDDAPAADVLEALGDVLVEWAPVCALLWSTVAVSEQVDLRAVGERLDERFEAFVRRGQADGFLRPDLPPRWVVYSLSAQVLAAGYAVDEGHLGEKAAKPLFISGVLNGFATQPRP